MNGQPAAGIAVIIASAVIVAARQPAVVPPSGSAITCLRSCGGQCGCEGMRCERTGNDFAGAPLSTNITPASSLLGESHPDPYHGRVAP